MEILGCFVDSSDVNDDGLMCDEAQIATYRKMQKIMLRHAQEDEDTRAQLHPSFPKTNLEADESSEEQSDTEPEGETKPQANTVADTKVSASEDTARPQPDGAQSTSDGGAQPSANAQESAPRDNTSSKSVSRAQPASEHAAAKEGSSNLEASEAEEKVDHPTLKAGFYEKESDGVASPAWSYRGALAERRSSAEYLERDDSDAAAGPAPTSVAGDASRISAADQKRRRESAPNIVSSARSATDPTSSVQSKTESKQNAVDEVTRRRESAPASALVPQATKTNVDKATINSSVESKHEDNPVAKPTTNSPSSVESSTKKVNHTNQREPRRRLHKGVESKENVNSDVVASATSKELRKEEPSMTSSQAAKPATEVAKPEGESQAVEAAPSNLSPAPSKVVNKTLDIVTPELVTKGASEVVFV